MGELGQGIWRQPEDGDLGLGGGGCLAGRHIFVGATAASTRSETWWCGRSAETWWCRRWSVVLRVAESWVAALGLPWFYCQLGCVPIVALAPRLWLGQT